MSDSSLSCRLAHALALVLACVALAPICPAAAAAPVAEFAVSPAQVQALGVTLTKLARSGDIAGLSYPAKVVVPPGQEQVVSAPVDGVVDRLLVSGQDSVKAGQPLLRLTSPEFGDLQLKVMEAAAKARLSQQTLARERALFSEGIIAERRVQEAQAAEAVDLARQRQAEAVLRLAGADTEGLKRAAAGGRLDDSVLVRAKAAGRVLGVEAKPGQRVKQADALFRLASFGELWLEIQLPADRGAPIDAPINASNNASNNAPSNSPKSGEIAVVGRAASAQPLSMSAMVNDNQTLVLRARVTRGAEQLRPGETVLVQVPFAGSTGSTASTAGATWALPLQAVARHEEQAYVFVRSAKGFVATPVSVQASSGTAVQLAGPLAAGQEVATSAVIALKAAWLGKGGAEK